MQLLGPEARKALLLSTLAGLSTGIGGVIAILKKPDYKLLSTLLGIAIGVMATLSLVELLLRNAYEHGSFGIALAVTGGALCYYFLQPYFPDFEPTHQPNKARECQVAMHSDQSQATLTEEPAIKTEVQREQLRTAELLRLGFLMALTMTLHNLPEGFAVAFSSYTDFGPYMAIAIAIHNIPEGVIVAAPVFAATNSRWKSLGIALASGLSEPLGALLALLVVKPFISEEPLHYILGFVGGIMLAVCQMELWPQARKCKADRQLAQGILLGVLIMAGTLLAGS